MIFLLDRIQQKSPCCPAVLSQEYTLCLASGRIEHQKLPRLHELVDAHVEGAILFVLDKFFLTTIAS